MGRLPWSGGNLLLVYIFKYCWWWMGWSLGPEIDRLQDTRQVIDVLTAINMELDTTFSSTLLILTWAGKFEAKLLAIHASQCLWWVRMCASSALINLVICLPICCWKKAIPSTDLCPVGGEHAVDIPTSGYKSSAACERFVYE